MVVRTRVCGVCSRWCACSALYARACVRACVCVCVCVRARKAALQTPLRVCPSRGDKVANANQYCFTHSAHATTRLMCRYFLRLRLPGEVVEDGRESCRYDTDTGVVTARLPKLVPGEQFEGLDLLTTLLARRAPARVTGPLIEVLDDPPLDVSDGGGGVGGGGGAAAGAVGAAANDADGWEWETEQVILDHDDDDISSGRSESDRIGKPGYGFGLRYTGTLGPICREVPDVVELPDPDATPVGERAALRRAAEDAKFDTEHYACDYGESKADPDAPVHSILAFTPAWRAWTEGGAVVQFSEDESEDMRRLPRKEFIVDSAKPELIGLIDIVCVTMLRTPSPHTKPVACMRACRVFSCTTDCTCTYRVFSSTTDCAAGQVETSQYSLCVICFWRASAPELTSLL
jgi:hypothetical protein